MQDNEDKETSTDEVKQGTREYKKEIPVWARFSVHTGPGTHAASDTMRIGSFFRGVKRPGRGVNHPPPSCAEVKERVDV